MVMLRNPGCKFKKFLFFAQVCIKFWEKLPDLGKIGSGLVPCPFRWGFLRGGLQYEAYSLWALMSYFTASAWALWPSNKEGFVTVFCGKFFSCSNSRKRKL